MSLVDYNGKKMITVMDNGRTDAQHARFSSISTPANFTRICVVMRL